MSEWPEELIEYVHGNRDALTVERILTRALAYRDADGQPVIVRSDGVDWATAFDNERVMRETTFEVMLRERERAEAAEARVEALTEALRKAEDAALLLWHEADHALLRDELPRLMDYMAHLHDHIEHEQAMVRVNVWVEPLGVPVVRQACPTCGSTDRRKRNTNPQPLAGVWCRDAWHSAVPQETEAGAS